VNLSSILSIGANGLGVVSCDLGACPANITAGEVVDCALGVF
jgi:hypothetical protein